MNPSISTMIREQFSNIHCIGDASVNTTGIYLGHIHSRVVHLIYVFGSIALQMQTYLPSRVPWYTYNCMANMASLGPTPRNTCLKLSREGSICFPAKGLVDGDFPHCT